MRRDVLSWNRIPRVDHARVVDVASRFDELPLGESERAIPHGNGRSYGDVCLAPGATVLRTRRLDRFIAFDRVAGRVRCEGGVLLGEILDLIVPQGWFLPVTPGTRHVTVGGAIANDVHGKNHHVAGSFGHHVTAFELLRSDGERLVCGPETFPEWYAATVGGLGLTGLITWADLRLEPIANPFVVAESRRFRSLDAFWEMNAEAERDWPYTVSWIDCLAPGGRGILMTGRHAPPRPDLPAWRERRLRFPVESPLSLVNAPSLRAFNFAYYRKPLPKGPTLAHAVPWFYPLDAIGDWNRMYGRRGFRQYQCVLPRAAAKDGIAELLARIVRSGSGSFLAVLKTFGSRRSVGMLSFPREGATLALDFPDHGTASERLFADLDAVVREAGGALYPAKDCRMSPAMFRAGYPLADRFSSFVDPKFASGFWRRVMEC